MSRSLVAVHRWAGGPDTDFYPWLSSQVLEAPALFDEVRTLEMPEPGSPTIERWVPALASAVGPVPAPSTVFLGHSVGCQTILRYLASLPEGHRVEGALLVAAWFEVDQRWGAVDPWLDTPIDFARARAALGRCVVVISDSDPFTSDWRRNTQLWEERMGAEVVVVPGGRHFNNPREPAILETLRTRFGRPSPG
ncbi:alpha/beta hydrolase [Myxococcus sp. K15C18031901]|uniref:RBBP9/YdeN family alpha/beta hydrolase n=1 Tax=Myxococcus dinghuensis TaxID=2906761 RepID=UPI0020A82D56|nr:alpha/beta hydrolase [Myxococcus dinghuensis]MCP3098071.1 alpha/beta hydrolase [Myxococcus dinghuensis]